MLAEKLIEHVESLQLNLKGKTVLTEAASGAYIVTPILAALAGAKVFAFSKDSKYGKAEEIFSANRHLMSSFNNKPLNIQFIRRLTPEIIGEADVITNSGHLRPLDEKFLRQAKKTAVIPLMYESWELRDTDIDVEFAKKKGIRVAGTNERHPDVDVFNYLGYMALKLLFDAGICPYRNKLILLTNNPFGPFIAEVLAPLCDGLAVVDKDENKPKYDPKKIDWIGGFPDFNITPEYRNADAVIFTAYPFDHTWIGEETLISAQKIRNQLSRPLIIRFAGDIDPETMDAKGINFFPREVHSGHMGILPSALGFDPIIRLQAGGLKVAEALLNDKWNFRDLDILQIMT